MEPSSLSRLLRKNHITNHTNALLNSIDGIRKKMLTGSVPRSHPTLSDSQPPNLHRIWTWKQRISIVTWSNPQPNGILREILAWRCHIIASLDTLRRSSRHKLIFFRGRSDSALEPNWGHSSSSKIYKWNKNGDGDFEKEVSPVHRINHTPRFPHRKNNSCTSIQQRLDFSFA